MNEVKISGGHSNSNLLGQATQGDQQALSQLLSNYRNYLKLLARLHVDQHLQAKADPSDLVQETQMLAFRDFSQFRGSTEAEFTAWLRRVLSRSAAMFVRHYRMTQARNVALETQLDQAIEQSSLSIGKVAAAIEPSPSQVVSRKETAVILADALAALPENYREAMILHHLESHSIRETANRMKRTSDSVKKLLARATIKLRAILDASR